MHMTDDEYAKLPVADRRAKVADVLGIDKRLFTHMLAKAKAEDLPSIVGPVRQLIESLDRLAVPVCDEFDEVVGAVAIEAIAHVRANLDRGVGVRRH